MHGFTLYHRPHNQKQMHTFRQLNARYLLHQLVLALLLLLCRSKKIFTKYVVMQKSNNQLQMHQDEFYSNTCFLLPYVHTHMDEAFEYAKLF